MTRRFTCAHSPPGFSSLIAALLPLSDAPFFSIRPSDGEELIAASGVETKQSRGRKRVMQQGMRGQREAEGEDTGRAEGKTDGRTDGWME